MEYRKVWALAALIPLLAMALTGLSLAHWDDEVQVTGSVSMGTFNVKMSLEDYYDNESSLDVGTIAASVSDYNDGDDVIDDGVSDLLTITIDNAYPGYFACVEFNIENAGTIPAETSSDSLTPSVGSSFDWEAYKQYFQFNVTYLGDPTDPSDDILLAHLDDDGNLVVDYNFAADTAGILYLNAGETEHFKACFGLESQPVNPPEDLMGQSIEFGLTANWIQAVP
jgi:hypothetical protein